MILYLSGNFPQLSKVEKEQAMADRITEMGLEYRRLMTFYYIKDCNTILTVYQKLQNKSQENKNV
jgi:hypothetical protein